MNRRGFMRLAVATGAVLLGRPRPAAARGRWWSGLVFAVFENHGFSQVVGLPSHRRLAAEGALLTRYFAVSHPSGPNYRALLSGETWGRAEVVDTFHPSVGSEAAALTPPIPTYVYDLAGEIATRHNPFIDLQAPIAGTRHGLERLRADLNGTLPSAAIIYVGWDDANDMHDDAAERADHNLTALLDTLAASSWFTTPDPEGRYPVLFFCYDEDSGLEGDRVFAAWWGHGVRRGWQSGIPHTHYSFCRTVTDNWGLRPLGRAAGVSSIQEVWA